MADNISVSSGSADDVQFQMEFIQPPSDSTAIQPETLEHPFIPHMSAPMWKDQSPWIEGNIPDLVQMANAPVQSSDQADSNSEGSGSDTESDQVPDEQETDSTASDPEGYDDQNPGNGEDVDDDDDDDDDDGLKFEQLVQGQLQEMSTRISTLVSEKREIEVAGEERVKRFQRESEELQQTLSELRSDNEQRHKLSQLSDTDLISMIQRKDREISFLSEEVDKYTKRVSELSTSKLSEQSQLEKLMREDERTRLRESAMEQQKEYARKRCEWLEEELEQKSKEGIKAKSCLQERICALEEESRRQVSQLEEVRAEIRGESGEKEKLRERLEQCLTELETSREEQNVMAARHRQEVMGQKKLVSLYQESAEQSEQKVGLCAV